VAWAKVLLPLLALALLSTVFLLARSPSPEPAIPFARLDEIAREARVDAPRLAGVAPDGTALTLTASRVTPMGGALLVAAPRLEAVTADGIRIAVTADTARAEPATGVFSLAGGIRLRASGGRAGEFRAATPGLTADLADGSLDAPGPVAAEAPFGRLAAGGLSVTSGLEGRRLVFHGGVRLLYHPETH
jgi:lipopolysaccharide export system protein LptC